jgi:hypothetical protein
MRRRVLAVTVFLAAAFAALGPAQVPAQDREDRIALGLKEALEIGTGNAVDLTGRLDGYFKNKAIKILVPSELRSVEKIMRTLGQGERVDAFVLAMNRAAERAAPEARPIFRTAIREMSFDDARKILTGKGAPATDYFKRKTSDRLTKAFTPIVTDAMAREDVTRRYKELVGRIPALPFGGAPPADIEGYVVSRSLDGLFYMVAQEEKKIRRDPVARVTDLLKDVFGGL